MKTEKQTVEQLSKTIDQLNELAENTSEPPTADEKAAVALALGNIISLGWVLDCENEITELLAKIKLAAATDMLAKKMGAS